MLQIDSLVCDINLNDDNNEHIWPGMPDKDQFLSPVPPHKNCTFIINHREIETPMQILFV